MTLHSKIFQHITPKHSSCIINQSQSGLCIVYLVHITLLIQIMFFMVMGSFEKFENQVKITNCISFSWHFSCLNWFCPFWGLGSYLTLTFFEVSRLVVLHHVPVFGFAWLSPYDWSQSKCSQKEYCIGSAESFSAPLGRHLMLVCPIMAARFDCLIKEVSAIFFYCKCTIFPVFLFLHNK